jgi:hypothetical protein
VEAVDDRPGPGVLGSRMMNRRAFLRASTFAVGALAVASCRPRPSAVDRYQDLVVAELHAFDRWLGGELGFVGEVGWPHTRDLDRWDALGRSWLREAAALGLWVTYWASGPWPPDYALLAHGGNPLRLTHPPGRALQDTPRPYPECNGVNLAGWEWDRNNYPRAGSFRYLAERGISLVRVPFAWERLQPRPGGAISDDAARTMIEVSDWALDAGCQVIWDCHNYEEVHHWFGGDPRLMTEAEFVDLWTRLSDVLQGHPGVAGYGLMNEPNPDTGSDARGWERRSQTCVTALRERGDDQRVFAGTFHWSNIGKVERYHPAGPWIDDPSGNTAYEVHHYFDLGDGGNYPRSFESYADEAAATAVTAEAYSPPFWT